MNLSRVKRVVLSALVAIVVTLSMKTVLAAPSQMIGGGPVQIPTSMDDFNILFPGTYGKVIALILFVGTFMFIRKYFFEDKERRSRRKEGIVGWGIPFIAALLITVIIGPPLVGMLGISSVPQVSGPNTSSTVTGPIQIRVLDKTSGAAVTSGKVYLLAKGMKLEQVIDSDAKGNLTAPVRAVGSDGTVRFDNVKPGEYLIAYIPASYAVGSYEPKIEKITVGDTFKPNSEYLVTSISAIEVYKMINVEFANEVGTAVSSYTWKPASYPADLQGFTVWLKPSATDGATPYMYIYVNYDDTKVAPTFKIGGTTVAPTKLSDLSGSNPLRLNAPSGYNYVLKFKINSLYGQDTKKPIEISGTFQGNATINFAVDYLAESERGDFTGPTFTFTANNNAASPGWG